MTQSADEVLSHAKKLLRAKKKGEARNLLGNYLKQNPSSEEAWWLMSFAVPNRDQKIQCLEKILQINPGRQKVREKLAVLTGEKPFYSGDAGPVSGQNQETFLRSDTKQVSAWRWIAPLLVIGVLIIGLVLYLRYRLSNSPVNLQAEPPAPQVSAPEEYSGLPPTWTEAPTDIPTNTTTPPPTSTATPAPTSTFTPDPNVTYTPVPESKVGTRAGKYPPDFKLKDAVSGEEISIRDFRGQPVLITFWAAWCPVCQAEMPRIESFYEEYKDRGFVILGVGVGESESTLRSFRSQNGLTYPVLADPDRSAGTDYLVNGVPTHYYIGKSGTIGFVETGPITEANLRFHLNKP